ncbi:MAG: tRNA (adenosine(37)-N6)-threonylcarbamoyltransferase complex dimerization subunit type 1 TsaB [Patescibacteria group bacterium]
MYLLLDTASPEHFTVALAKPNGRWLGVRQIPSHFTQSEKILPAVEQLLKKHAISPPDISCIMAVTGPGGFTSLRIGVITADTLGYAWRIPVVSLKTGEYDIRSGLSPRTLQKIGSVKSDHQVMPEYGRPPNITKPRQNLG